MGRTLRAQREVVKATDGTPVALGSHPSGTIRTYCLEHLATAAKIPAGPAADLAAFVRTLRKHGDCQTRSGGVCDTEGHETQQLLAWGPPEPRND